MKPIVVMFGTRPEIIKLAPLVELLGESAQLVHTGQHFDSELARLIADDVGMSIPTENLGVGASTRSQQIGKALLGAESLIGNSRAVVVQGDTNSALAGALAANATQVPLFHVESGLRSYDRRMPEEHNRILIDHLADMCWAPTAVNVANLRAEAISEERILQTGNPIVEAIGKVRPSQAELDSILGKYGLVARGFALTTLHRPENVDEAGRLESILRALVEIPVPVVFPMHPRTAATAKLAKLDNLLKQITVIPPIGYREFLALLQSSALAISDSGGVQEEVSVLKIPLVVLRRSSERPEVLGTFATITDDPAEMVHISHRILSRGQELFEELSAIPSPYGEGSSSRVMVDSLIRSGVL
jgi:UDP-N-acetylglucosamine 2-epimerase (non-hydrolysing)